MVKTVSMEGAQAAAATAPHGDVKTCVNERVIREILGEALYWELYAQAAQALYPELPELAIILPVMSFNTAERGKLTFYTSLTVGKFDEETTQVPESWARKFPDDDGELYRKFAKALKWT